MVSPLRIICKKNSYKVFPKLFKLLSLYLLAWLCAVQTAFAAEYSLSAFGTIQYTQSNSDDNYLRFADDQGTLKVNSIVGFQLDAQFNQYWSGTVQYVLAPKQDEDEGVEIDTRWAFINFQPNDNWSFKLGRQRLNFYLDSETLDVGHTYIAANLGPEIYFNAGVLAGDGGSVSYEFTDDHGYFWSFKTIFTERDIVQRGPPFNRVFEKNEFDTTGVSAQVAGDDFRFQIAYHDANFYRPLFGTVGAIPVSGRFEGDAKFTHLGFEKIWTRYILRTEYSLTELEFASAIEQPFQQITSQEPEFEEHAGNLLLARKLGHGHLAYVAYGRFVSKFEDQHSLAIGGKYVLSPSQSIKAEWMQVHEKRNRRQLSDNRVPDTTFDLFSLSYNWVWP